MSNLNQAVLKELQYFSETLKKGLPFFNRKRDERDFVETAGATSVGGSPECDILQESA